MGRPQCKVAKICRCRVWHAPCLLWLTAAIAFFPKAANLPQWEGRVNTSTETQSTELASRAEPCFRLIYRSRSLLADSIGGVEKGLSEILRVSRINNRNRGVTGALVLYEYKHLFAQALEGPEHEVQGLFDLIKSDPRHEGVEVSEAEPAPDRLFGRWAMALVAEHGQPDAPLVATEGGVSEAAPWRVTSDQEQVLTQLRNLTRAYGRGY